MSELFMTALRTLHTQYLSPIDTLQQHVPFHMLYIQSYFTNLNGT
jgi:hypothetical protein